jgi:methylenetetrahydrofolate/methylenetetrahydromethanopterin dehydrogenase (NADP+)
MAKPKILIQLDTDLHASVFDAVVAVDAGVDHLLQYSNVKPESVRGLVHGAMFTRGPGDLHQTAIFVGGNNVAHGEAIAAAARDTLSDPFRVSIMLDSNGSNSTAAAAVLCAREHIELEGSTSVVLAATGPVGQRVCRILANAGGHVYVGSRTLERAKETIGQLQAANVMSDRLMMLETEDNEALEAALSRSQAVFACGAAGVRLLTAASLHRAKSIQVAVDLNAVSPAGIEGIDVMDKAVKRNGRVDYGALGVGGLKMKIHKASVAALFESNTRFLDCDEMLTIGKDILAKRQFAS